MVLAAAMLWIVYPLFRFKFKSVPWKPVIVAGSFLALHFALWISSLESTSVASSLVLVTMNPVIVALGSTFYLKERPSGSIIAGTAVSIVGCLILIIGEGNLSAQSWTGNLLALGGAVAMSFYMLTGRKIRSRVDLYCYITLLYSVSGILLVVFCKMCKVPLMGFTNRTWLYFLLIALIPQIVGHSVINWTLKYMHASFLAVVILLEPLVGSVLAYWVLREGVTVYTLIGGILILGGVAGVFLTGQYGSGELTVE